METLSEISTGHLIIALVIFIICLFLVYYLVLSLIEIVKGISNGPDNSELSARARYEQTAELIDQIKNNKNQNNKNYGKANRRN